MRTEDTEFDPRSKEGDKRRPQDVSHRISHETRHQEEQNNNNRSSQSNNLTTVSPTHRQAAFFATDEPSLTNYPHDCSSRTRGSESKGMNRIIKQTSGKQHSWQRSVRSCVKGCHIKANKLLGGSCKFLGWETFAWRTWEKEEKKRVIGVWDDLWENVCLCL